MLPGMRRATLILATDTSTRGLRRSIKTVTGSSHGASMALSPASSIRPIASRSMRREICTLPIAAIAGSRCSMETGNFFARLRSMCLPIPMLALPSATKRRSRRDRGRRVRRGPSASRLHLTRSYTAQTPFQDASTSSASMAKYWGCSENQASSSGSLDGFMKSLAHPRTNSMSRKS